MVVSDSTVTYIGYMDTPIDAQFVDAPICLTCTPMHSHALPCTPQHVQPPYSAPRPSSIPPPLIACLGFVEYDNYYEQSVDGTETRGE